MGTKTRKRRVVRRKTRRIRDEQIRNLIRRLSVQDQNIVTALWMNREYHRNMADGRMQVIREQREYIQTLRMYAPRWVRP